MIKKIFLSLTVVAMVSFFGCSHPYVPVGAIYTNASGPLAVTANQGGTKEGRATAKGVLGIVSFGDGSAKTAAINGGISKIKTVDVESFNVLGIYYSYTTIVTGE
jgi:hypothetical protein